MRAAWALERAWTKDEILEAYLNLVTFRGELQGVAAAAELLFDKAPHGLSGAEARELAALLRGPNADRATLARRAAALAAALGATVDQQRDRRGGRGDRRRPGQRAAAHGAGAARRPPAAAAATPAAARWRGTTLDAGVQRAARDALRRQLPALRERGVHDGAVLVVDNASGDVLAYVGSSGASAAAPRRSTASAPAARPARRSSRSSTALALEQRLLTAGVAARRHAARDPGRRRPLPAAQLRRRLPRPGRACAPRWPAR